MIGTGIRYWVCDLEMDLFHRIDQKRGKYSLELALFNFDFLELFGLSHWSELSEEKEQVAFHLNSENKIEIKRKAKKLAQFTSIDLLPTETLFPLYHISPISLPEPNSEKVRLIILEEEIGLISSFQLNCDSLQIDDLTWEVSKLEKQFYLNGINYQNKAVHSVKNDSVNRAYRVIL